MNRKRREKIMNKAFGIDKGRISSFSEKNRAEDRDNGNRKKKEKTSLLDEVVRVFALSTPFLALHLLEENVKTINKLLGRRRNKLEIEVGDGKVTIKVGEKTLLNTTNFNEAVWYLLQVRNFLEATRKTEK